MSAVSVQTYRAVEHVWADGILAGCATVVYHVNSAGAEAAGAADRTRKIQERRTDAGGPYDFTIYVDDILRKETHRLS